MFPVPRCTHGQRENVLYPFFFLPHPSPFHTLVSRLLRQINDIPAVDNNDISRLSGGTTSRFRFASNTDPSPPHPSQGKPPPLLANAPYAGFDSLQRSTHSRGGEPRSKGGPRGLHTNASRTARSEPERNDVLVQVRRATPDVSLGVDLREPGLTLEKVTSGSPAELAGCRRFIGHQLTHVCGNQVATTVHILEATRGLTTVDLRFKIKPCGLTVRRARGEPWGFGVDALTLEVADVQPGSAADKAGVGDWEGHRVTHLDGVYMASAQDMKEKMKPRDTMELVVRLCPWSVDEVKQLPNSEMEVEEADVFLGEATSLGLGLTKFMVVSDVQPDSAGWEAQLEDYVGWRVTHIDGLPVLTAADVKTLTRGKAVVKIRFAELLRNTVKSPDVLAVENVNQQMYREWLARRSADMEYARQSSPDPVSPLEGRSLLYSRIHSAHTTAAPSTVISSSGVW